MDHKQFSHFVVEKSQIVGSGIFPFGEVGIPVVHKDSQVLVCDDLTPKTIRGFLWEHRNTRVMKRGRGFLGCRYQDDKWCVWIGEMVPARTAVRIPATSKYVPLELARSG